MNRNPRISWEAKVLYDPLIAAFANSLKQPETRARFEEMDYEHKCRLINKAFERGIMAWGPVARG